jgi:glycosyltransferase involved in cell wall biosynthesis
MRPQTPPEVTAVVDRLRLPRPYFLYVGRNHPRKNLPMLRRAYADARGRGLQAGLVFAGPGHDPAIAGDGVMVLPYVSAADLPALYAGALAVTIPSRFEGFGFPALEAMRCGTAGALPEVVGAAGILLSPLDAGGWSHALLQMASDPELQRRLIDAGIRRSAGFTWEITAEKTWRVLEAAATAHRPATVS